MNNMSSNSISIPVNGLPTHIVVWQDTQAQQTNFSNNTEEKSNKTLSTFLTERIEYLTTTVNILLDRVNKLESSQGKQNHMESLHLPPASSYLLHSTPLMRAQSSSSSSSYNLAAAAKLAPYGAGSAPYGAGSAPRSPLFPPMVSSDPIGLSVRPKETVTNIFSSLLAEGNSKSNTFPEKEIKYDLNAYTSDSEEEVNEVPVKVSVVKVESEATSIEAEVEEEVVVEEEEEEVEEEVVEEEEVEEEVEEEKGQLEEEETSSHQQQEVPIPILFPQETEVKNEKEEGPIEEEVEEEEVEEEVEEEAMELTEFEFKGKTYYRDGDNQVYVQDEDGDLNDTPIGVWNPEKNKILKYA
jgi:hypothetical protein